MLIKPENEDDEHPQGRILIRSWDMHICQDVENGEMLLGIILYNAEEEPVADIHWTLATAKREYVNLGDALKELNAVSGRGRATRTAH
jgi:hypothetical protein